ncbi:MAG: hypothetical protein F4Y87_09035 [Synechococcus sp. SB0665_bin_28]|nr:hypothetical protein [Synechococcus sp. SB0667_bin_8]MXY63530.1 hypothetical protein [Synechococcus sp. SB0665_bin_28]
MPRTTDPMPALPPGLTEWLPSGFFTALLGLIWYEVKAGEAGVNKRMNELREDRKELRQDLKDGLGDWMQRWSACLKPVSRSPYHWIGELLPTQAAWCDVQCTTESPVSTT